MKRFASLIGLTLSSTFLMTSCNQPEPTITTFEPGASDLQAIKAQLAFDGNQRLTLKDNAGSVLTPEQLDLAQHGLEVSNYMVSTGQMKYTSTPDGTMVDATVPDAVLTEQGLCDVKISSVKWISRSGMWSASNNPTTCGKWVGNHFNSWDAWIESVNKTPRSSHWSKTYGTSTYWSMFNQFQCHFLVVRGTKTPWNLEPSRPNVGYPRTVAAGCNPGGGSD